VERDGYLVTRCKLDERGACPRCGTRIAGRFERFARGFGRRRIPVRVAA
jgi:pyruvate formate lyase activating enzyme